MGWSRVSRVALLVLLSVGLAVAFAYRGRFDDAELAAAVSDTGAWGPVAFVALYALAPALLLPSGVLMVVGGALFGPLFGPLYGLLGATLGALLPFVIARHLAARWIAERVGGRLGRLIDGVEREGWRFVAFTRLVPIFPFNLLNYGYGLTRVRPLPYLMITALCLIPSVVAYGYLGYAGREVVVGGEGDLAKAVGGVGLVLAALYLPRLAAAFVLRASVVAVVGEGARGKTEKR